MGSEQETDDALAEADPTAASSSLQEKMARWEASEEEQRAKTLGGNLPLVALLVAVPLVVGSSIEEQLSHAHHLDHEKIVQRIEIESALGLHGGRRGLAREREGDRRGRAPR